MLEGMTEAEEGIIRRLEGLVVGKAKDVAREEGGKTARIRAILDPGHLEQVSLERQEWGRQTHVYAAALLMRLSKVERRAAVLVGR